MSTATKTLKLPFLRLNRAKAEEFSRVQTLNTQTANAILAMTKPERRLLTSKAFAHTASTDQSRCRTQSGLLAVLRVGAVHHV